MREHLASTPQMPEKVGRYDLLLPIASGGMATVYLARARGVGGFERLVALKLTHAHLREHAEFSDGLIEEAKLAARIRHPNVVPVLDVGDDPHGVFLVMEYVEGDSLSGLQRRAAAAGERLPTAVVSSILIDALGGLHAAHELKDESGEGAGLVHRDFSPQNILVGVNGIAWLTDFGVAKAATRLANTATGLIKGKISYMSPEQARGEPLDRRCDVWAAGVVAWEALAGRKLHQAEGDVATLLKIATQEPPRLRTIVEDISPELEHAVASALTMDRAERCPTALAFAKALRMAATLADREEVAEHVARLAGAKLQERQSRAKQLGALRAQIGEIAGASIEAGSGNSGLVEPDGSRAPPAVTPDAAEAGTSPTLRETQPTAQVASARPTVLQVSAVEQPATDTTSVTSTSHPALETGLARARRLSARMRSIVAGIAAGALVAAALGVIVFVSRGEAVTIVRTGAFQGIPGAAVAHARPAALAGTETPPMPSGRSLSVRSNAPMTSIRVDGLAIVIDLPTDTLIVPVQSKDGPVKIDARSSDGRVASARVPPGTTAIELKFGRTNKSQSRPPAAKPDSSKPRSPFPASPFTK